MRQARGPPGYQGAGEWAQRLADPGPSGRHANRVAQRGHQPARMAAHPPPPHGVPRRRTSSRRARLLDNLPAHPFPPALDRPPGNILDNAELLTTLEGAKSKAVEIADKLEAAKATAAEVDAARVRYGPVAARGSALFFAMAGLAALNVMYEYSLASFLGVFNQVPGVG